MAAFEEIPGIEWDLNLESPGGEAPRQEESPVHSRLTPVDPERDPHFCYLCGSPRVPADTCINGAGYRMYIHGICLRQQDRIEGSQSSP